jgi:hypothetical protein
MRITKRGRRIFFLFLFLVVITASMHLLVLSGDYIYIYIYVLDVFCCHQQDANLLNHKKNLVVLLTTPTKAEW